MSGLGAIVRAEDKFWETQNELIAILAVLGVKKHPKERLEPFKLLTQLRNMRHADGFDPTLDRAIRLISFLVQLRRLGKEPSHKNKKYV